jgi:hypothetical protein
MKEYTLYDKLEITKNEVFKKPFSINLNLLLFSYLTLLKNYEELLDHTTIFSMSALKPSIIGEDFRSAGCIAKGNIEETEIQLKYSQSIDPEDPYNYLFQGLLKLMKKDEPGYDFEQSLLFLRSGERKEIENFLNIKASSEKIELYQIPDIVTEDMLLKVERALEENPYSTALKLSLAEILTKKGEFESARERITMIASQYPYYPRATALLAQIYWKTGNKEAFAVTSKTIAETNPLNIYNFGLENFIDKDELAEIEELKNLFKENNPLIAFFKDMYNKIEAGETEKIPAEEETTTSEQEISEAQEFEVEAGATSAEQKLPEAEEKTKEIPEEKTEEVESEEDFEYEYTKPAEPELEKVDEQIKQETTGGETQNVQAPMEAEKEAEREPVGETTPASESPGTPAEKTHLDRAFELLEEKKYNDSIKEFIIAIREENHF